MINQKKYIWVLTHPVDSQEQIKNLQVFLNKWNDEKIQEDGRMGTKTKNAWVACLDELFPFWCEANGFFYTGQAVKKSRIRKDLKPSRVIWHWTGSGRTAESLGKLWVSDSRMVSSHCGIDEKGVYFYAPLHVVTYHAGNDNEDSIGIDICTPPLNNPESEHRAKTRGIYAGTSPDGKYLMIDEKILFDIRRLRKSLSEITPRYQDHAFVDPQRKIDCIPWREQLKNNNVYDE